MRALAGQLLVLPVLFCLATFGSGQGKEKQASDFTGTWVIDEVKSSPWITQFGKMKLQISFADPKLRLARDFKQDGMLTDVAKVLLQAEPSEQFVYFTDGRGEKNRSVFDPTVARSGVKSKTTLDGGKIVVRSSSRLSGLTTDTTETWELSSDGRILTETTTTVTGLRTRITQAILNRAEKH